MEEIHLQKILDMGLKVFRETCILPQTVNFDYSNECKMRGETIDVRCSKRPAVTDVGPNKSSPTTADIDDPWFIQVPLSSWKESKEFSLTDKDLKEIEITHKSLKIEEAVASLSKDV